MINSFAQYLIEEERTVFFTFGRFNPPTIGHGKLLDVIAAKAGRNPYKIFLSQSQDPKKNPLSYSDKIKYVRKMFPKHARNIMISRNVRTAIEAAVELYNQGYRNLVMVVGQDRVREFDILLNKYNGKEARHGFYNFQNIKVISAGDRDPDAEGVEGMSASKLRNFAAENDFTTFSQGLPSSMSNREARRLFNDVRKGMGLKEEKHFKNHVQLDAVSQLREDFVAGKVLNIGDKVCLKGTDVVAEITVRGSNYVIVEAANGNKYRKWITDVDIIEDANKVDPKYGHKPSNHVVSRKDDNGNTAYDVYNENGKVVKVFYSKSKAMDYADKNHDALMKNKIKAENYLPDYGTDAARKRAVAMTPGQKESTKTAQDPDIKDREGTQPKRYHTGLSRATKVARDRHFKKGSKMDDDNPAAYKPAPGDATAKTIPSKHTRFVNKMMSEQPMDQTRDRIAAEKERAREQDRREKQQLKVKHDRMLDTARRAAMLRKNRGVSND